jgi:hypothetical protein
MSCQPRRRAPIVDVPAGAPGPFEPGPPGLFIERTAGGFSRLFPVSAQVPFPLELLDAHFPMGYTNLWVLERVALRVNGQLQRWPATRDPYGSAPAGRFFLLGDDGTKPSWHQEGGEMVLGWATQADAEAALDDPELANASAIVVARLVEDIDWH